MSQQTPEQLLITSLYEIGAIQFGEFKLKSGQTSSIYLNLRIIISYPNLLRIISELMWDKIRHCQFDIICGVPYTALPIATCLSLSHDLPMIMRRKEKKDYGTKQLIEGVFSPGQRCLIIEDVVTTGGSIFETAKDLEEAGLKVHDVIALIDREQGGKAELEKKYTFHHVLTMSQTLKTLSASSLLSDHERHLIDQFGVTH